MRIGDLMPLNFPPPTPSPATGFPAARIGRVTTRRDDMTKKQAQELVARNVWSLAGPHNADARQAVMLALTGKKVPKAKCGIHALEDAATGMPSFEKGAK